MTPRGRRDPGWYNLDQSMRVGRRDAFAFADGRWITIEAEEDLGHVNAASPGFPVDDYDPAWVYNSGWALTVVLSNFVRTTRPD